MLNNNVFIIVAVVTLCIVIVILTVNTFTYSEKNKKIKILTISISIILLLILMLANIYKLYSYSDSLKTVYKSAFNYYLCLSNQLLKDNCNASNSTLEASKAKAELAGETKKTILTTEKLAKYEADPNKTTSPYIRITNSLTKSPLFITPENNNYLMYIPKICPYIDKPLYWVVGWNHHGYTIYVAVYKINKCPTIDIIDDTFPIITKEQYILLNDGEYWRKSGIYVPEYNNVRVVIVPNPYNTEEYFKKFFNKLDEDEKSKQSPETSTQEE